MQVRGASIQIKAGFVAEPLRPVVAVFGERLEVIAYGLPIYVALKLVDMRYGCNRLVGMVREGMGGGAEVARVVRVREQARSHDERPGMAPG